MAEFLLPYTELLAQIAAVAMACALAAVVLRGGIDRVGFARAAVLSIAVLMGAVSVAGLWSGLDNAADARSGLTPPPGVSYAQKCMADQSQTHMIGYLEWLEGVMPADAVYAGTGDTCYAFQLLPRVPARPGQRPDWTIYPQGLSREHHRTARRERRLPEAERTVFGEPGSGRGAVRTGSGG